MKDEGLGGGERVEKEKGAKIERKRETAGERRDEGSERGRDRERDHLPLSLFSAARLVAIAT